MDTYEGYEDYMRRRNREEDENMNMKQLHEMMDEDDRLAEEHKRNEKMRQYKSILSEDTLDMLAKDALTWHRNSLIEDIQAFESESGYFVHRDDYVNSLRLLAHFNAVCEYFGIPSKGTQ